MRVRLSKVYDMVALSLSVITRDRSRERIEEAVICCLLALRKDGHVVGRPIAASCVMAVQKRLDKLPKIQ